MNNFSLQETIRECILEVLSETGEINKVCMYCELIKRTSHPESTKSHGLCREHLIAMMRQVLHKNDEQIAAFLKGIEAKAKGNRFEIPNTSGAKSTDPLPKRPSNL